MLRTTGGYGDSEGHKLAPVRWVISDSVLYRHLSVVQQLTEADDDGLAQRYCLIHRMSIFKGACLVLSLDSLHTIGILFS